MTPRETTAGRTLVVGLGHPDRGDDAVGGVVIERMQSLDLAGVDLVEHDEPIRLLDLWPGYDRVIVVDAVRAGGAPGTVHVRDPATATLPASAGTSSHVLDLTEVVELARSIDQLPSHLVLVGVEAADIGVGRPVSPAVRAAIDNAIDAVIRSIDER
jgi:hydrogenase maturation protease